MHMKEVTAAGDRENLQIDLDRGSSMNLSMKINRKTYTERYVSGDMA